MCVSTGVGVNLPTLLPSACVHSLGNLFMRMDKPIFCKKAAMDTTSPRQQKHDGARRRHNPRPAETRRGAVPPQPGTAQQVATREVGSPEDARTQRDGNKKLLQFRLATLQPFRQGRRRDHTLQRFQRSWRAAAGDYMAGTGPTGKSVVPALVFPRLVRA